LRQRHWQASLVPLLLSGGVDDTSELRVRALAAKMLQEILQAQAQSGALQSGSQPRRASIALVPTSKEAQTPEALLASNLRLSLNLWVLLHFTHFSSAPAGDESMFDLLTASLDAIEDHTGWLPHTILLVRVLLVSLVNKIHASTLKRSDFPYTGARTFIARHPEKRMLD
jgi:hypothetical protein